MLEPRHHQRTIQVLGALLIIVQCLLWWATGTGRVAYVSTHGTSMVPMFRQGDLAVVRRESSYRVGQVVAYRSAELRTVVLHRIVEARGDRFVMKGDHNTWSDPDHPRPSDIVGALWFRLPHGGSVLGDLRGRLPLIVALLLVTGGGVTAAGRGRRRRTSPPAPLFSGTRLHVWRALTLGCGATTVALSTMGFMAFTRSPLRSQSTAVPFTEWGAFDYSAAAPVGPTYPSGRVVTGDPVYLRLVPGIDLAFSYRIESRTPVSDVSGTVSLTAVLADATGWQHKVTLQKATPFLFGQVMAKGRLDITRLQELLEQMRSDTGVQGGSATVTIAADVSSVATIGDSNVTRQFRPTLTFALEPLQLRLRQPISATAPSPSEGVRSHLDSSVLRTTSSPDDLVILGRHLRVAMARRLSMLAVLAAAATLWSADRLRRQLRAEPARIELRHGHRIIPVAGSAPHAIAVDVTTMQDLARLAEQENRLILHHRSDDADVYLLRTDRAVYRYTARQPERAASATA